MRLSTVFCVICLQIASVGIAQVRLEAIHVESPPTIDGVVDDGTEWASVPSISEFQDQVTGERAPESSRFWIAYDKDFVYFAARLNDSQPGAIKATEYRTNVSVDGDDNVQLLLDLSGSLADFNQFDINPRGATNISLAGGRAAKREWQGEFVAKARITESGWEAEARIPWQIMRLPGGGKRDVRIVCFRNHNRTSRTYTTSYSTNQSFQNAAYWSGVELPAPAVDRSILLLPYVYLGHGESESWIVNSGVDMKTNLASEIPLVVSVNPDFRNIENDILSLDFSRFERLAGETRPFFQEGRQYYNSALFASQRIAGFDVGANVYGKLDDKLSFGVLNTMVVGENDNLATNFSFDPNPNESYRFTGTSRREDGANNDAYLLRYYRSMGPYSLFLRTMGTKDTIEGEGVFNTVGFYYNKGITNGYLQYDAVGAAFFPRLGFAPETDYRGWIYGARLDTPVKWGTITEATLSVDATSYDTYNGDPYRRQLSTLGSVALKDGTQFTLFADWESFFGSSDHLYQLTVLRPRNDPYNFVSLDIQDGEFFATKYRSIGVTGAFKPIPPLQLTGSIQAVDFGETSDQAILGFNYDLGEEKSISGRVVKRDDDWNAYIAFRRSGNRGTEYFLIIGDPNATEFQKSVILKVTVPLSIKR